MDVKYRFGVAGAAALLVIGIVAAVIQQKSPSDPDCSAAALRAAFTGDSTITVECVTDAAQPLTRSPNHTGTFDSSVWP